jgi:glyoxylate reductase
LITRSIPGAAVDRLREDHEVEVSAAPRAPTPDELRRRVRRVEGLLCCITERVDAALLDSAPRLRVVSNYAVGVDNIDLDAARSRGIPVGVTPDVVTPSTAEVAMLLLLAAARRLPEAAADVRRGAWGTWDPHRWLGLELAGARLAVVGPGRIGRAVADRASAFGMQVIFVGREDDLLSAVGQADAVSVHVPLTAETRHLIDEAVLRAMQPHAVLVNTSRGGLVDQIALRRALFDGEIAGAGLDVTDPEPLSPEDPLLDAPGLVILPHIGSATHRTRERMTERAVENLVEGLSGRPLPYPAA